MCICIYISPFKSNTKVFCWFNQSSIATIMLYRQPLQISTVYHHKTLTSLPCISWSVGAGLQMVGTILFMSLIVLKPTDNPRYVFHMVMAGAQYGKPNWYKHILSLCFCHASANISLAKSKSNDQAQHQWDRGIYKGCWEKIQP